MKSNTHNIRFAVEQDAKAIAVIHVNSWQKIYRGHIPDTALTNLSVDTREGKWREFIINDVKILVIEKDNAIVGFASLCASRDADTDPKTCGEISAIYLDPDVWYQGLGKELCKRALAELENMGFSGVTLWVLEGNNQARKFYEKMGFSNMGITKVDQYDDKVVLNEICYRRQL